MTCCKPVKFCIQWNW